MLTRRAFVATLATAFATLVAFKASAQDIQINFLVKNQSAFARTIEFWDLANNNHAQISFQPNQTAHLALTGKNGGDGRMKYRVLPNGQWFERGWIKAGETVSLPG